MKTNYIYNPFVRIAGYEALLIGLLTFLATCFFAFKTGTHFIGLSEVSFAKDAPFWFFFIENLIAWLSLSVFVFIIGLFLSKSRIRFCDVLGTLLLARVPLIIVPCLRLTPAFQSFIVGSWQLQLTNIIYYLSMIWTLVLVFNAIKVSCNLKEKKLIIVFIVSVLLAEVISITVINNLN